MPPAPTTVLLSTGIVAPAALGAAVITDDKVYFVGILAACVVGVAGLIAWIRSEIKGAIRDHEETEKQLDAARHAETLAEIRHVRELIKRGAA